MRVLGIDPGLNGGAAVVDVTAPSDFRLLDAIDLPVAGEEHRRRIKVRDLAEWISALRPDVGAIERAQAMPKQGASSGFKYGRAVGSLEATVVLVGVRLLSVEPRSWKQHFALSGKDKHETDAQAKAQARELAIKLFAVPGRNTDFFPLVKHHNRAEAALIALYCGRQLNCGDSAKNP